MINRSHDLPIMRQAELLNVSRGSVYYEPQPASAEDPAIMLAADLNRMSSESLSVERGFANNVAMIEAAHSNGLTKTRSIFESQIHALRGQLIDAEAALAKSSATRESRGILAKILPTIGRSYSLERKLIRSGLFDADWYKSEYPEVAESGLSAARHYLDEGYCRGSSISLVSRDWNCQIPSTPAQRGQTLSG